MIVFDMDNSNSRSHSHSESLLRRIDHLVYAAPNLEEAIAELENRLGIRAAPGGSHPGRGTRNALIALSPTSYLEILAPDPGQPRPANPLWLSVDSSKRPRIVAWAAKGGDLERFAADAERVGVHLGAAAPGSRRRPDGALLTWKVTDPTVAAGEGVVPFFIDWEDSPHPARTAEPGVTLIRLRAEHPDPALVQGMLDRLGLDLRVEPGPAAALIATVSSGLGEVELR